MNLSKLSQTETNFLEINDWVKNEFGFEAFIFLNTTDNKFAEFYLFNKEFAIDFKDASSGLIQILPVILSCVLIPSSTETDVEPFFIERRLNPFNKSVDEINDKISFQILLIEQPELHLHPKLQSKLAELFNDSIKDSNTNLFIETHSEHLIRKIQVLIAKGELDKEKVGVWYFDNNDGATKIKEMIIEPNGFFKESWPNGFFDDSANLSWELLTTNRN